MKKNKKEKRKWIRKAISNETIKKICDPSKSKINTKSKLKSKTYKEKSHKWNTIQTQ